MKAKRIISIISLVVILLLSSVVMFACGKEEKSTKTFNTFDSVMSTIKQDTELFTTKNVNGYQASYCFNDFYEKDSLNNEIYNYDHYYILTVESLSFIDAFYPLLKDVKLKTDYSSLKEEANSLKKAYNKLSVEYTNLKENATELDYRIYNGYFARYRQYAIKFLNQTYDCAFALGKFLIGEAKLTKGIDKGIANSTSFSLYLSYNTLNVFEDLRRFFVDSCKGAKLEGAEFTNKMTILNDWLDLSTKALSADGQKIIDTVEIEKLISKDRAFARKGLSKFSFYKYETSYNSSIDVYAKKSANAPAYYKMIDNYFNDSLTNYYNYLLTMVV